MSRFLDSKSSALPPRESIIGRQLNELPMIIYLLSVGDGIRSQSPKLLVWCPFTIPASRASVLRMATMEDREKSSLLHSSPNQGCITKLG